MFLQTEAVWLSPAVFNRVTSAQSKHVKNMRKMLNKYLRVCMYISIVYNNTILAILVLSHRFHCQSSRLKLGLVKGKEWKSVTNIPEHSISSSFQTFHRLRLVVKPCDNVMRISFQIVSVSHLTIPVNFKPCTRWTAMVSSSYTAIN